jgi:hypothetical protein
MSPAIAEAVGSVGTEFTKGLIGPFASALLKLLLKVTDENAAKLDLLIAETARDGHCDCRYDNAGAQHIRKRGTVSDAAVMFSF